MPRDPPRNGVTIGQKGKIGWPVRLHLLTHFKRGQRVFQKGPVTMEMGQHPQSP
jgi:hypothetical protein